MNIIEFLKLAERADVAEILLGRGFQYSQIAVMLSDAVSQGFIIYDENDNIKISDKGHGLISSSNFRGGNGPSVWIQPAEEHKIPQLDTNAVYLPKRRTLNNLRRK